jgi:hypothetical protein
MGNQQYERSHTQDDTHFSPNIHDSTQPLSYLYVQKYPGTRTRLPFCLAGLPIVFCVLFVLRSCC